MGYGDEIGCRDEAVGGWWCCRRSLLQIGDLARSENCFFNINFLVGLDFQAPESGFSKMRDIYCVIGELLSSVFRINRSHTSGDQIERNMQQQNFVGRAANFIRALEQ
jgi:hypothetical protein